GLFYPDIMKVLKFYQYEKIEFLFDQIKNELGHDLTKSYNDLSEEEKHTFWYVYFENSFYDKKGKARSTWVGFNTIIGGYIVISKSDIKEQMKTSKDMITCPICEGTVLNHNKPLKFGNKDIRELINLTIDQVLEILGEIPALVQLKSIVGGEMMLTEDVSLLSRNTQASLKMFELE
ncbi:excinuclease ABC subunit A, partial [Pseudomonas sp. 2995-1]